MYKFVNLFLIFLVVINFNTQITSARSLRIKRDFEILSIESWKGLVGLGTTTTPKCLEFSADENICLGEEIDLADDSYEFKHVLVGASRVCPIGTKQDRNGRCRKVLITS